MLFAPTQCCFEGFNLQIVSGKDIAFDELPICFRQSFGDGKHTIFQYGTLLAEIQQMDILILRNMGIPV